MGNVFLEITLIIILAAGLSIIFRFLKQPLILAYILTGIIIGPFGQLQLGSKEILQAMGEFGITLLLFMLGLEIKLKEFRIIGKPILLCSFIQIVLTGIMFYIIAIFLNFSSTTSLYISIAMVFSSTIIVLKELLDKKDLNSLYGKISIGILLVQDLVAIIVLMLLSGFTKENSLTSLSLETILLIIFKALALFILIIYLSKKVFPKLLDKIAKSEELLFLTSIAWVFGLAALVSSSFIGFSIEIGGFLAGLSLANASENFQIAARTKSLRDFFITIFFIFLGMQMEFSHLFGILGLSIILSMAVLILKPIVIMLALGVLGYRKRTSFFTGVTLAQISEFSLIIVFLGNKLGHLSGEIASLITVVSIITFIFSSYEALNLNSIYKLVQKYLGFLERKVLKEEIDAILEKTSELENHIVLIGANRMGSSILESIKQSRDKIIVVDFDPDVIKKLKEKNINTFFGDISDLDIQEKANLAKAKLVISTVPDVEDNLVLIKNLKDAKSAKIIVAASDFADAKRLYKEGADYVVMPHLAGGRHIAKMLEDGFNKIEKFKDKDLEYL